MRSLRPRFSEPQEQWDYRTGGAELFNQTPPGRAGVGQDLAAQRNLCFLLGTCVQYQALKSRAFILG
jgi:hypothetical protein